MITSYEDKALYDQRHGGPFDRGSADSYYGRPFDPHYYRGDTHTSDKVLAEAMSTEELESYTAGYEHNEKFGDKKDYR